MRRLAVLLVACWRSLPCAHGAEKKKIVIGLVAKSQSNPCSRRPTPARRTPRGNSARSTASTVTIDWQTPPDEDAQKQAEAIEQLARGGAQGIAVSVQRRQHLHAGHQQSRRTRSVVMCFDSDAPRSKRLCYYGTDDITCGKLVMAELAKVMGDKGTIAILAGNQTAPNLQKRMQGVKDELKNHPGMKLLADGVFYHPETPEQASEAVNTAQSTHPEIEGWAMIGGWPLFAKNALKWPPGQRQSRLRGCAAGATRLHAAAAMSRRCSRRIATAGATSPWRSCSTKSSRDRIRRAIASSIP